MAAQPAIAAPRRLRLRLKWSWLSLTGATALALLVLMGLLATVLLAVGVQRADVLQGRWLAALVTVGGYLPYVLTVGAVPALVALWSNRVRLAGRIGRIMLVQFVLACAIAVLPLWLVNIAVRAYFDTQIDASVAAAEQISDQAINQAQRQLGLAAVAIARQLAASPGEPAAVSGLELDELRDGFALDLLAVVDSTSRIIEVSPTDGLVVVAPLEGQRLREGLASAWLRETGGGGLQLVQIEPLASSGGGLLLDLGEQFHMLWLERTLPHSLSDSLKVVETGSLGYSAARSLRVGVEESLRLVVLNALALLLLVAAYAALFFGNRLGGRLDQIGATMERVANQDEPRGMVPVEGDDEIAAVSGSFNTMVAKVGTLIAREKSNRARLQTIQDTMDAGVIVLDRDSRVVSSNAAAGRLLGTAAIETGALLAELGDGQPALRKLAGLIDAQPGGGGDDIQLTDGSLLTRTASLPDGSGRIVLLTDISEPLAVEKLRVEQAVFHETLHGINNPLQVAMLKAERLQQQLETGKAAEPAADLAQILHQLERIRDQAKWWEKKHSGGLDEPPVQDLNAVVASHLGNAEHGGAEIAIELDPAQPLVYADANLLHDALENLLANARQQFAISAVAQRRIRIRTFVEKDKALLIVDDNGGGIDSALLPRIFVRNVSFKRDGKGIGLARLRESLAAAGGTVSATNIDHGDGRGLRFTMTLRLAPPAPPA